MIKFFVSPQEDCENSSASSKTVLLPPVGKESVLRNLIVQTKAGRSESAKGVTS